MSLVPKKASSNNRWRVRVDEYRSNEFVARYETAEAQLGEGRVKLNLSQNGPKLWLNLGEAKVTVNHAKCKMRVSMYGSTYEMKLEQQVWERWVRLFKETVAQAKQHTLRQKTTPASARTKPTFNEIDLDSAITSLTKTMEALHQLTATLDGLAKGNKKRPPSQKEKKVGPEASKSSPPSTTEQPTAQNWRTSLPKHSPAPPLPNWTIDVLNELLSKGRHFKIEKRTLVYNEPMNALQLHVSQSLPFSYLLDQAATERNASNRMALVAAFVFASQRNHNRVRKPFEPFLGETFEFDRTADLGWRTVWEKVVSGPSTLAGHTVGRGWTWWRSSAAFLQVETTEQSALEYEGFDGIELEKFNERYQWAPNGFVLRIMKSQLAISHRGHCTITCNNNLSCQLHFKPGAQPNDPCQVSGQVVQEQSTNQWSSVIFALSGKCGLDRRLFCKKDVNGSSTLLDVAAPSEDEANFYAYTPFDVCLNQIVSDGDKLPKTDCRRRPDVRLMEEGKMDQALLETKRLWTLEKSRLTDTSIHRPLWFEQTHVDGTKVWRSNGTYWKKRKTGFEGIKFPTLW